eukprot:Blabericola_migrator_1__650@NODE_1160_length_5242_cov_189_748406_g790_i0_p1_GENE_NODE_1160_length_5242_cov_189_748406_g790_i0NODE_1160_length_5242_cov_189_748406_g790_i0_p1_ORF_typecomplete_len870_score92_38_NODE_1160_length_5242_cov_189_748406_g790_i024195028
MRLLTYQSDSDYLLSRIRQPKQLTCTRTLYTMDGLVCVICNLKRNTREFHTHTEQRIQLCERKYFRHFSGGKEMSISRFCCHHRQPDKCHLSHEGWATVFATVFGKAPTSLSGPALLAFANTAPILMDLVDLCGVPDRNFRFGPILNGRLLEEKACQAVISGLTKHFRRKHAPQGLHRQDGKVELILKPLLHIEDWNHDSDTLSEIFKTLNAFGESRLLPSHRNKWSELITRSQRKYEEVLNQGHNCNFSKVDQALNEVYLAHLLVWDHFAKDWTLEPAELRKNIVEHISSQRQAVSLDEDIKKRMATYMVPKNLNPESPVQSQEYALQVYSRLPPPNIMRVGIDNVWDRSLNLKDLDVAMDRVLCGLAAYAVADQGDVTKEEAETVLKIVAPQRVAPWVELTPMEAWINAITPSRAVKAAFMSLVFTVTQRYVDSTTAQRLRGLWTTYLQALTEDPWVGRIENKAQRYLNARADIVTPAVRAALENWKQGLREANDAIYEAITQIKPQDSADVVRQALGDAVARVMTVESVPRAIQVLIESRIEAVVEEVRPKALFASARCAVEEAVQSVTPDTKLEVVWRRITNTVPQVEDSKLLPAVRTAIQFLVEQGIDDVKARRGMIAPKEFVDVAERKEAVNGMAPRKVEREVDVEKIEPQFSKVLGPVTPELFANFARKNYVRLQGNKLTYTFFAGSTPCTSFVQPLRCNMLALIAKTVDERKIIATNPAKSYIPREDVGRLLSLALDTDEVLLEIAISQAFEGVCPDVSADRLKLVAKSMGLLEEMPDEVHPSALAGLILFFRCFERHLAADPYLDQVIEKMPQSLSFPFTTVVQTARQTRIPSRRTREVVQIKLVSKKSSRKGSFLGGWC